MLNGERVYNDYFNNVAFIGLNGILSGCGVTEHSPNNMSVDVAAGTMQMGVTKVTVGTQTVIVSASHPSYDRMDLILISNTGVASVLTGTAASVPKPLDTWDPNTHVCVARVFVGSTVTSIVNVNIKDMRVSGGGAGTGGATVFYNAPQNGCSNADVVRFDGGNFVKAQADTVINSRAVGVINNVSGPKGDIYLFGNLDFMSGLIPGTFYYLSATTAGAMTSVRPALAVKLGIAESATNFLLDIDRITTPVGNKYVQSFSSATTVTVNHNLNDSDPIVQVYDGTGAYITPDTLTIISANQVIVTFSIATNGKVVVFSMIGFMTDTGITSYYGVGFTSQTTVVVNHNLNQQYVVVGAVDLSNNVIEPATVVLDNPNTCTVTFSPAQSGYIIVVGGSTFVGIGGVTDFLPAVNNLYDIGSPALKWQDGFFAGNINVDGKLTVTGPIDPTFIEYSQIATPGVPASGKNRVYFKSDDKMYIQNSAGSEFVASGGGELGTIIMHAPTIAGAMSIPNMRIRGWAVCDGTTPTAQGITGAIITITPNMVALFPRGNATTSGGTGGADSATTSISSSNKIAADTVGDTYALDHHTHTVATIPSYYEVVFMIKVK